jgi:dihydroxyacetone kinase-like protein
MCVINGCGATTLMEQLITYRDAVNFLKEREIAVVANMVGEILTVQETGGYQLFIARMDDELLSYWKEYSNTPYYKS